MKIAINCIYFTERGGGITEYIRQLISHLVRKDNTHEFIFYITQDSLVNLTKIVNGRGRIKLFPYNSNQKIKRSIFQQNYWNKEEGIECFDIFHSPFFYAPKFKYAKTILTVHDLRFLNYPKSYTFIRYLFLKLVVIKSILKADYIIAISNFTKNEIMTYYDVPDEKISVIYEAVNSESFILNDFSKKKTIKNVEIESDKFILTVGHLEPRKNYIRLIKAYLKLPLNLRNEYRLVIVGKLNHDFKKIINKINISENVVYLDFVSSADLVWLYANCKLHAFPSFYEGFGFSSLEAGLFSKPTIGANQSSIPEISGKGGVYFNPFLVDDILNKMLLVLNDELLFEELSEGAKENVSKFSWDNNVTETINLYEKV